MGRIDTAWRLAAAAAFALLGCREAYEPPQTKVEPRFEPARQQPSVPAPPTVGVSAAYLEGALLEGRYDTRTLAELVGSLPRPSQLDSPLIGVFAGIVDALLGDPAQRLDAVGLRDDDPIELSMRALDGQAAAARKLLGELARAGGPVEPERLARLTSDARTLGVHLRASLPTSDRAQLLRTLASLTATGGDGQGAQAKACASLSGVALCSAGRRVLLWARDDGEDRLRVDAIYLFYDGVAAEDLARALARADTWPGRRTAVEFGEPAPLELRMHAHATRELLEAEALADAVLAFSEPSETGQTGDATMPSKPSKPSFDYAAYLHQEAALGDLVPAQRVADGIDLDMRYEHGRLTAIMRWLPGANPPMPQLFAPVIERGTLPLLEGDCAAAQVCARVAGIAMVTRFTPLARGAFSDATGAARILRQAGDNGSILLGLCSWPNLMGTAGMMARSERGLMSQAQSSLLDGSMGLGLMSLALGDDPATADDAPFGEQFVGYLRVGPKALDALRQVALFTGLSLRPLELEGVAGTVERGSYEDVSVYLVDEATRPGGFGAWLIAADADARVEWLLATPREPAEPSPIDPLWYLRVASLGPIAAREQVSQADDPPIRAWLDGRSLELRGRFVDGAPMLLFELGPAH
jgi:hypothetical protein